NTLKAPSFAVWGLNAGFEFANGVTVFVDARNLTDERYISEFSAVTDARAASTAVFMPGEGRSAFVGVSARF
ncbi:MAG: TonB-dependent receptor, partial [Brevundimonas sp.]